MRWRKARAVSKKEARGPGVSGSGGQVTMGYWVRESGDQGLLGQGVR